MGIIIDISILVFQGNLKEKGVISLRGTVAHDRYYHLKNADKLLRSPAYEEGQAR